MPEHLLILSDVPAILAEIPLHSSVFERPS